jgi:hypothetical protein
MKPPGSRPADVTPTRRSAILPSLMLAAALAGPGVGGCGSADGPSFGGEPDAFESRAPVVGATTPPWVVTVVHQRTISRFAVLGDYIYFAAHEAGLYRARKSGGPVETIDAGADTLYNEVAAGGDQVYWLKITPGRDGYPHAMIRQQAAGSNQVATRYEGDWGTLWSDNAIHFQADRDGVYLNTTPRGAHNAGIQNLPRGGGVPIEMLAIADVAESPTWVVDDNDLFFTVCKVEACQLARVAKAGGATQLLGIMPAAYVAARAVDAHDVYLNAPGAIWKMAKQGGDPQVLYPLRGTTVHPPMVVDENNLYFLERKESGQGAGQEPNKDGKEAATFRVRAIATNGGNVTTIATGVFSHGISQMAQDAQYLYLLHGETEIVVVAKPPLPAPTPAPGP